MSDGYFVLANHPINQSKYHETHEKHEKNE